MSEQTFKIGNIALLAHFDPQTGHKSYSAEATAGVCSDKHAAVDDALAQLADKIAANGQMNEPLKALPSLGGEASAALQSASEEQLRCAKAILALSAWQAGMTPAAIAQSYSTPVGDAILSIVGLPPVVREHLLAGTGVSISGSPDPEAPAVITVSRECPCGQRETYLYKLVRMPIFVEHKGRERVKIEGYVLIPEIEWPAASVTDPRLLPAPPPPKTLTTFAALIESFDRSSRQAYEALPNNSYRQALSSEHGGPLLAYVHGVLRWMIRHDLHKPQGLTNPWYAMGIALGSRYGIETPEQLVHYAISEVDEIEQMDVLPDVHVQSFTGQAKTDGTQN